eukprot:TRINITY_DN1345_c0_g1_i3.p1 TRINITY_DN1345_c0_g1~~TRINITY_DN1345_c0_g1_i3.p1  ORF type:complete len:140 (-),score=53.36 TRINITY_DN1345_c0_g1_i3:99-494(-)
MGTLAPTTFNTMKAFTFLLLVGLVCGQDWTCDECAEGGEALGAFASSETSVPDCGACSARVDGATDALAWEETITAWVSGLQEEGFCGAQEDPEQCKEAVAFLIPLAFPVLVAQPRDWVDTFCVDIWGCQA